VKYVCICFISFKVSKGFLNIYKKARSNKKMIEFKRMGELRRVKSKSMGNQKEGEKKDSD